jgi:flagellin-like hook-associated protein FlgL
MRNSLLSIGDITSQINVANKRLATGKRVNDVIDNAQSFFLARGFNKTASDLATLQDNIGLGIKTIETATKALDGIEKLLGTALGLVKQARSLATASPERTTLNAQATSTLGQITNLANDASFNGRNVLKATPDNLVIEFNTEIGAGLTSITIAGVDTTNGATGLNVVIGGTSDAQLDTALADITAAISTVRTRASNFAASLSIVQVRQDYNKTKLNNLRAGADILTLADMNEEGANLSTLQTRQQLAVTSLQLANQADQGILRLF